MQCWKGRTQQMQLLVLFLAAVYMAADAVKLIPDFGFRQEDSKRHATSVLFRSPIFSRILNLRGGSAFVEVQV
jgi:hypothetical protein